MRLAREKNTKVGYFETSTTFHPNIRIAMPQFGSNA